MTIVESPPRPQPSQDELEALIEEARRRARRRRLLLGAAVVAVLAVAGLVTAFALGLGRGSAGEQGPPGFHAVRARGPVQHAVLDDLRPVGTTLDVASGKSRPMHLTREVWWDAGTGLYRTLYRYDGRAFGDIVQQNCFSVRPRFCLAPSPFDLSSKGMGWPPKENRARRVGTGTFRGRPIVWVEGLMSPGNGTHPLGGSQVGYDAATHEPLVLRQIVRDGPRRFRGVFSAVGVKLLPTLPAKAVSFEVPPGGAPRNAGGKEASFRKASLERAREVLGHAPLWLGRSYRGQRLRFVQTGLSGTPNKQNRGVGMVPLVRFDYGPFRIDEFGDQRPAWLVNPPPVGKVFDTGSTLQYGRDGLVVQVVGIGRNRRAALELVRSLRPVG
jgi:hypothetical protein